VVLSEREVHTAQCNGGLRGERRDGGAVLREKEKENNKILPAEGKRRNAIDFRVLCFFF